MKTRARETWGLDEAIGRAVHPTWRDSKTWPGVWGLAANPSGLEACWRIEVWFLIQCCLFVASYGKQADNKGIFWVVRSLKQGICDSERLHEGFTWAVPSDDHARRTKKTSDLVWDCWELERSRRSTSRELFWEFQIWCLGWRQPYLNRLQKFHEAGYMTDYSSNVKRLHINTHNWSSVDYTWVALSSVSNQLKVTFLCILIVKWRRVKWLFSLFNILH